MGNIFAVIFLVIMLLLFRGVINKIAKFNRKIESKSKRRNNIEEDFDTSAFIDSNRRFKFPDYNINSHIKIKDVTDYREIKQSLKELDDKINNLNDFNLLMRPYEFEFEVETPEKCLNKLKDLLPEDLKWMRHISREFLEDLSYFCSEIKNFETIDEDESIYLVYEGKYKKLIDILKENGLVDENNWTLSDYLYELTVNQLKDICRDNNLKVSGTKDELIERIVDSGVVKDYPKRYRLKFIVCKDVEKYCDFYLQTLDDLIKDFHPYYKIAIYDTIDSDICNKIHDKCRKRIRRLEWKYNLD